MALPRAQSAAKWCCFCTTFKSVYVFTDHIDNIRKIGGGMKTWGSNETEWQTKFFRDRVKQKRDRIKCSQRGLSSKPDFSLANLCLSTGVLWPTAFREFKRSDLNKTNLWTKKKITIKSIASIMSVSPSKTNVSAKTSTFKIITEFVPFLQQQILQKDSCWREKSPDKTSRYLLRGPTYSRCPEGSHYTWRKD